MKPIVEEIRAELFLNQDLKFREFHCKLIPTVPEESVIGIRTPVLRNIAKKYARHPDVEIFLNDVPHRYFDENQLHIYIVSLIKDYDECVAAIDSFLPFVDNWATCDQLRPKVFDKSANRSRLLKDVKRWIDGGLFSESGRAVEFYKNNALYTQRFGIEMLMTFFLDDDFEPKFLKWVARIKSDEYYLNMMIAWFLATALAKQYEATLPLIEKGSLGAWTHNKAIQKALESFRISPEQKAYLRSLKKVK